jgi:hypothetical protein
MTNRFVFWRSPVACGSSPAQIAQDLARVQSLGVDEVFFNDQASSTVEEAIQRLQEIQAAVRQ